MPFGQLSFDFGDPRPKAPTSSIWTPEMQAQLEAEKSALSQRQGAQNVADRFARFNQGEVSRAVGQAQASTMSRAGTLAAAWPVATGAWETGKALKDRVAAGEGLFSAMGNVLRDNTQRSAHAMIDPGMQALADVTREPQQFNGATFDPKATPANSRDLVSRFAAAQPAAAAPAAAAPAANQPITDSAVGSAAPSPARAAPSDLSVASPAERFALSAGDPAYNGQAARTYTAPGAIGQATGVAPVGRAGGFIGSSSDAEAARNMQAAADQSAAAQANIARMNAAEGAQRDLRAAKLGIPPATLDQLEGRAAAPAAPVAAPAAVSAFDRPGDGFGDAELRRQSLLSDLGSKSARKQHQAMAMLAGMQADAASANDLAKSAYASQLEYGAKQADAGAKRDEAAQRYRSELYRDQSADRRAELNQRAANDRARLNARVGLARVEDEAARAEAKRFSDAQEKRDDRAAKLFEDGSKVIDAAVTANGKNPPEVDRSALDRYVSGLDTAKLAEFLGGSVDDARRIKAGRVTPDEARKLLAMAKPWAAAQSGWHIFSTPPSPTSTITPSGSF